MKKYICQWMCFLRKCSLKANVTCTVVWHPQECFYRGWNRFIKVSNLHNFSINQFFKELLFYKVVYHFKYFSFFLKKCMSITIFKQIKWILWCPHYGCSHHQHHGWVKTQSLGSIHPRCLKQNNVTDYDIDTL